MRTFWKRPGRREARVIRYASVCSGIEAASVAWHGLGWKSAFFSEIEAFPSAVLAHRWPGVPNLGDFTLIGEEHGPVDLLVGGTPCQSFSVAGLRGGLADDRGNLALQFLRLAARLRARWVVWENVPGVLSSGEGRDFGCILGGLAELGYGFAYRILDAQHFGVPQRRRRVFVVGYLGDWRPAAAVLFERASLRGDPPPSRKARQEVAGTLGGGSGSRGWADDLDRAGAFIPDVSPALKARDCKGPSSDGDGDGAPLIVHSLRAAGFDASEDGTGRGTPLVTTLAIRGREGGHDLEWREDGIANAILTPNGGRAGIGVGAVAVQPFDTTQITSKANRSNPKPGDPSHPLAAGAHPPAIAFSAKDHGADAGDQAPTLRAGGHSKSHANGGVMPAIAFHTTQDPISGPQVPAISRNSMGQGVAGGVAGGVRRLTPRECERLQGFSDDWTLVPFRGKPASDGPRYRAIGNSMAVPVMRWIGQRIAAVESLLRKRAA